MRGNAPCYNCPDRAVGCHGDCEKYRAFGLANKDRKAKGSEGDVYDCISISRYIVRQARKRARRMYA